MGDKRPRLARWAALAVIACAGFAAPPATGADPENCLLCHRYPGFGRMDDDGQTVRFYHVNPQSYHQALGPHARLSCTDCHPREEVAVVPHQPVSPVDCTSACHLTSPDHPPRVFAHDGIGKMLDRSVHAPDVLAECNELLGHPLSPGQSTCLLCHEDPRYRRPDEHWFDDTATTSRCDVCHDETLPIQTDFALWHVMARTRDARGHRAQAQSCALCHSNRAIRARFNLPDSVASYLASFHGKAVLLDSEETADCLDCHVADLRDAHLIRSPDDKLSSVHEGNLPFTCRSAACHPGGGAMLSEAAVHLELTPTRINGTSADSGDTAAAGGEAEERGFWADRPLIEYGIAVAFVGLILITFGPSALLQALELLQVVLGRHSRYQHQNVALARRVMADPAGRRVLTRFTVHQRVQHWLLFVCFTLLVLTGYPIKFADRDWAGWLIQVFGGLPVTRGLHRWAGLVMLLGAVYHMLYVLATMTQRVWREKTTWRAVVLDLPLVINLRDLREFFHLLGFLLFMRDTRPRSGRFSIKEKFEYFGVFWGCALLGVTGLVLWENAWATRFFSGRLLNIAAMIHTFEAFLALLHVGIFHMIGVIFAPHVFPLSMAMLNGDTPPDELAEAHAGLIAEGAAAADIPLEGDHV
jgi:formate dehydrogenase subunit gamma